MPAARELLEVGAAEIGMGKLLTGNGCSSDISPRHVRPLGEAYFAAFVLLASAKPRGVKSHGSARGASRGIPGFPMGSGRDGGTAHGSTDLAAHLLVSSSTLPPEPHHEHAVLCRKTGTQGVSFPQKIQAEPSEKNPRVQSNLSQSKLGVFRSKCKRGF